MNKIELYDILTLNNNEEYTVLEIIDKIDKRYLLIAPIDENEEPNFDNIKIVEEIKENEKLVINEITDENIIVELSEKFITKLEEQN